MSRSGKQDMSIILGIDVGGSTTKIVGFDGDKMLPPMLVRANDPVTSVYGAFGKFVSENGLSLSSLGEIRITGVGASRLGNELYGVPMLHADEFRCNARGGLFISGLQKAIIVSMGTGTAFVWADGKESEYLGGTGVGGGTLTGLSRKLIGIEHSSQLSALASDGDLAKVNLLVGDIAENRINSLLSDTTTASNFGKISDLATSADLAKGLFNMVYETIGMLAVFATRQKQCEDVVLIGNLAGFPQANENFATLSGMFGVNFIIPELYAYGTVIGAALGKRKD